MKEKYESQIAFYEVMADLIELRDKSTGGHVRRTKLYMEVLINGCIEYNIYRNELSKWDMESILLAAQIHDIGKIGVDSLILNKPVKLTNTDRKIIEGHVNDGTDVIFKINERIPANDLTVHALHVIRDHHEKWDGSGYPFNLKGNDITLEGRLMAVIDVYDALTSDRPYKKAFTHEEAAKIIEESSGTHFDSQIIEVFKKIQYKFAKINKEEKSC